MLACVKIVSYSIIINVEPSEPFPAAKGLRQGDPMPPFLFAIAIEYLSRCLNGLKKKCIFKYRPKCSKIGITHLSFADDLLLFARGDMSSVTQLQQCLNQFYEASGLKAN
ncbi:putative mitochondrial protein AtMg01250 [Nicotiana tabacum]|uniref:Mitochondrial protein AtMg01250 n=1 Tax=Nicotiana tabacum TaxID=4097 RepID=A0AC58TGQ4_TOBAC